MQRYIDFDNKLVLRHKIPLEIERECIQRFFDGVKNGIFVDVGANDPYLDSQSFHLEQLGWSGLLIEPLPDCANCYVSIGEVPLFHTLVQVVRIIKKYCR
jgi:hypothetical protein